jgi:phenylalanyl-tRNA synthetase beta chain
MPTITLKKKDLDRLIGRSLSLARLDEEWPLVKGEPKGYDEATDELKLELNDTNRPDLWCVEGVARQIKAHLTPKPQSYPFYNGKPKANAVVTVDPALKAIRPYIGACIARGLKIDEETLVQLIQTQEKLSEGFGRKRQLVSIGLYRLEKIVFPVSYKAVQPSEARFTPLGFDKSMTLSEVLARHPKGMAYAGILSSAKVYPLLTDREDKILSFPPIINSREIGEVQAGDRDLFVEVTGTDLRMVILTVNILAANLADRGAAIEPVEIRYPFQTEFGKKVVMPKTLLQSMTVGLEEFSRVLGEDLSAKEISNRLSAFGYRVKTRGQKMVVAAPAYRDDLMHPVDVVEDYAISRGYQTFAPEMPTQFTVGGLSAIERFSDRVREHLIGMGFQEVISNILMNREELSARRNLCEGPMIEVENVMSQSYSALRNGVLPSLMRVEAASSKSFYPHRIFEVGEAAISDDRDREGTRTLMNLAALIAHPQASFSELHSYLDLLMYYLGKGYQLRPMDHPSFIPGRIGMIIVGGKELGLIGEVHPQVLENWQITMPCAVLELELEQLM